MANTTLTMIFDEEMNLIDVQSEGRSLAVQDLKDLRGKITRIKVPMELVQTDAGRTCIHTPDCRIRCY